MPYSKVISGSSSTMDGINAGDSGIHMSDTQHSIHIPYVQDHENHQLHQINSGNGMDDGYDNGGDNNTGGTEGIEGDVPSNPGNLTESYATMVEQSSDGGDQLTLSFRGQVYVFDSLSPEKVHQYA